MSKKQIIRFAFIIILLLILYSVSGLVATCQGETKSDVLFMREALVMGIERNPDFKITELNVPIRKEGVTVNPTGKLVDGMFARVRLSAGQRMALAVSRDALQRLPGSGTFYVFVVNKDKAVKRTIKTGLIRDQYAEVLDGLSESQKVVTSGAGRLRSGTKVVL